MCHTYLGFNAEDIELFRLVPFSAGENEPGTEIAVRINGSSISMRTIERMVQQKDKFREQLQKANEALRAYLQELRKMKEGYAKIMAQRGVAKPGKFENLEEENEKLHKLLQTQITNAENLKSEAYIAFEGIQEDEEKTVSDEELVDVKGIGDVKEVEENKAEVCEKMVVEPVPEQNAKGKVNIAIPKLGI